MFGLQFDHDPFFQRTNGIQSADGGAGQSEGDQITPHRIAEYNRHECGSGTQRPPAGMDDKKHRPREPAAEQQNFPNNILAEPDSLGSIPQSFGRPVEEDGEGVGEFYHTPSNF